MVNSAQLAALFQQLLDFGQRAGDASRAHTIAELTAFSFLIERGLASPEEIAERLLLVQRTLPETFRAEPVTRHLGVLTDVLRQAYAQRTRQWTPVVIQGGLDQTPASDPTPQTDE